MIIPLLNTVEKGTILKVNNRMLLQIVEAEKEDVATIGHLNSKIVSEKILYAECPLEVKPSKSKSAQFVLWKDTQ